MNRRVTRIAGFVGFAALVVVVAILPAFVSDFKTQQYAYVGVYLIALRTCPNERQLGVGCVELGDDLPRRHSVALGHAQLEQPAADLGRDLHIGRFDLP